MAHKVIQFWKCMTDETVLEMSSKFETRLFDNLPKDLVLVVTRLAMQEYADRLEPVAGEHIDEFLCFAVRTHIEDGDLFIDEAWGIESDVPYPTSKCFRLL